MEYNSEGRKGQYSTELKAGLYELRSGKLYHIQTHGEAVDEAADSFIAALEKLRDADQ
jgi:hypothetical protein